MSSMRVFRRFAAILILLAAALAFAGCKRDANQVPELQSGAVDARPQVEGFALVAAGRGTHEGQLAIELEFSQPLAAGQSFGLDDVRPAARLLELGHDPVDMGLLDRDLVRHDVRHGAEVVGRG